MMRNSFLVVKHEIVTTLSKASFWLMALLFPLFILLATVVPSFWVEESMPPPDFFTETAVIEDSPDPATAAMAFTVPIAAMFIFFFLITMSSGYMLQSVSREKENRTVEVLLLSLEPRQLMLGKMIGLSVVALLQMAIWAGSTLLIMQQDSGLLDLLRETGLSTGFFVWALSYLILGYLMYASLMGAIGALVPTAREGAQFTFFVLLPLFIPILFNYLFINAPDSPLAVGFSLFPLTAPIAMMTRMVTTTVPVWQLAASLLTQAITAYLFVLLAAYFFRADTLLANTSLSWRHWIN